MFKRVEKRRRKQKKEEELGLDSETKEMFGLNDTDSDESSSSSNSGSESESENGRSQRVESLADVDEDGTDGEIDDDDSVDDEDGEEVPFMSVSDALKNPLYIISVEPDAKGCIICPRKLLKNPVMTNVHLNSNAHTRRFVRIRKVSMDVDADTDVRDLVRSEFASSVEKPMQGKMSKRAEKKKAKLDIVRAKRAKQKIMKAKHKAKKNASVTSQLGLGEGDNESSGSPTDQDRNLEMTPELKSKQGKYTVPRMDSPSKHKPFNRSKSRSKDIIHAEPKVLHTPNEPKRAEKTKKRRRIASSE